jgi:hypothetical protein
LSTALAVATGATLLTACSSDPVPTKVTVAWADSTRQAVNVSWTDTDAPNRITIEGVLSTSPSYVKFVAADAPNTWAIPTSAFPPDGNYKVSVGIGTSTGGMSSKLASSPVFDTSGPVRPRGASATPTGKGDVLIRWTVPPQPEDFSPHDPLDVPAQTQLYVPVVGRPGQPLRTAGPGTTSMRQVVKNLKPPYLFQLRAQNEWSTAVGGQISARSSTTEAVIPAAAQYGLPVKIRGRAILQEVVCADEGSCVQQRTTSAGLPVVVLTQVTPHGRWTPAARGKTTSGGHYEIPVVTSASRPYKVMTLDYSEVGSVASQSTSKARLTQTVTRIQTTGFLGGSLKKRGETVTAIVVVKPAMNTVVTFQSWNKQTRHWASLRVPMRRGQAVIAFKVTRAGTFAYRFVIPKAMSLGRPLLGKTTQTLALRVR